MDYTFTRHAYDKIVGEGTAEEQGTLARRVYLAASRPSVTYGVTNQRAAQGRQERHIRDGIVAVVNADTGKIITFYADVVEADVRSDQTDDAARSYAADRAARLAAQARRKAERKERDRAFTSAQKAGGKR